MQSNPLRASSLASLSLATLLAPCFAQTAKPDLNLSVASGSRANLDNDLEGLPAFLLKVPGGPVWMGLEPDEWLQSVAEGAFWMRPDQAHVQAKDKFVDAMKRSVSMLGRQQVEVRAFLLGKWPVKNSEYQVYVDQLRAEGKKVRPPFLWWRWGSVENYNEHLPKIRQSFPGDELGPVLYWERHGHELPYKVQDKDGKSTADMPVTCVSWIEANAFAARLGMRLPTEAELTRAMRGDGQNTWPLGGDDPKEDKYSEKLLEQLRMANSRDLVLKPTGSVPAATGPYGHVDMFGQVWQFCADLGYEPMHGADAFSAAWKKLQKDKVGQLLTSPPEWRPAFAIAKCGSYLSYQEPVQLMIDARAPMQTIDVLESLGFRLAKDLRPGYDYLFSMQRVAFNRGALANEQDLDLEKSVGAEHYTLAANGFPTAYEAIAFAPANWLVDDKRADLNKLLDQTQETPIVIGGLATTGKLVGGIEPGMYTVLYRNRGVPRALSDALKWGHREVKAELKRKERAKDKPEKEGENDKGQEQEEPKDDKWLATIRQYGLDKEDLVDSKAADGDLGFVRVDGVEVSTKTDMFLLHGYEGRVVAAIAGTHKRPTAVAPFPSTLAIGPGKGDTKDKALVELNFGVPLTSNERTARVASFDLEVVLDQPPPTAEQTWRLPAKPK